MLQLWFSQLIICLLILLTVVSDIQNIFLDWSLIVYVVNFLFLLFIIPSTPFIFRKFSPFKDQTANYLLLWFNTLLNINESAHFEFFPS